MNFVFDLDGTLSFDGQTIDTKIISALENLRNSHHQLTLASARPIRDMIPLLGRTFFDTTWIGGNGSIVAKNEDIIDYTTLADPAFTKIKELIHTKNLDYMVDSLWHYSLNSQLGTQFAKGIDPLGLAENVPLSKISQPIKVVLLHLTQNSMQDFQDVLADFPLHIITHSNENNLDMTAANINKFTTLQKHLDHQSYIAFGNDYNDTQMLENAKISVKIGNSLPKKFQTDFHLPTEPAVIAKQFEALSRRYAK